MASRGRPGKEGKKGGRFARSSAATTAVARRTWAPRGGHGRVHHERLASLGEKFLPFFALPFVGTIGPFRRNEEAITGMYRPYILIEIGVRKRDFIRYAMKLLLDVGRGRSSSGAHAVRAYSRARCNCRRS